MTADQAVYEAIKHLAPTYPDVAPDRATAPWIVYQQVGGSVINWIENSASAEWARIQISVWAKTRMDASRIARECATAIQQSAALQGQPLAPYTSDYEPDTRLHGCRQDFRVMT